MGRYSQDKGKKKSNTILLIATIALLVSGVVGWLIVEEKIVTTADTPELRELTLPAITESEPDNSVSLPAIDPVVTDPVTEINLAQGAEQNPDNTSLNGAQILPELDVSDALFREDMLKLSPKLKDWLNTDELIRKLLLLVNDIAQESLLNKHTRFLLPKQPFIVEQRGDKMFMSTKNYQRFNAFALAIDKIDVPEAIEVYKKFRPLFAKVFSEFSYPEVYSMEDSFTKAAAEMLALTIIEEPIELIRPAVNYKYADPKLEALNTVHKQMLRMGPNNTRLIQNKVRQLVEALVNLKE